LTKIRVSAHTLAIETGRYSKPKILASERFCKFCRNVMEDEKHFILNCSQYETLRGKYKIFLDVDNDIHSIRKLLNPTNSKCSRKICSFLKEAFETNKFDSVSAGPI
jgi:GH25 family lysozyme M1 (1,4-beta-N-acetylmuramidase)